MRVYQINGINQVGAVVNFSTADNPASAIQRLQEARCLFLRAWVSSEDGTDVNIPDLIKLARQESETQMRDRNPPRRATFDEDLTKAAP